MLIGKEEIKEKLKYKGDFVKIDYLTRLLEEELSNDLKKFVCIKLAEIYEQKMMFSIAAKMYDSVAISCIAFSEKIKYYLKEAELFIEAGRFERVEEIIKNTMTYSNEKTKQEIFFAVKELYKKQAEEYELEGRINKAAKIYEKMLEKSLSDEEKKQIKEKLLKFYDKIGDRTKHFNLKSLG